MSRYRKITTICCAAVLALGLAACGGGDDGLNTSQEQELQEQKNAADEMVAELQKQLAALQERLGIEGEEDPGHDVANLRAEIERLEGQIEAAAEQERMETEKAAAAAMAATAVKLHAGISMPVGTANDNDTADDPGPGTRFARHAVADNAGKIEVAIGAAPNVFLSEDKDAMVADNHGWQGKRYTRSTPAADGMYEAMVYSNVADPTPGRKFGTKATIDSDDDTRDYEYMLTDMGRLTSTNAGSAGFEAAKVAFTGVTRTAGTETFKKANPDLSVISIPGSYHGVSGTYRCTPTSGTCSATVASKGFTLSTTDMWEFEPASPSAQVMDRADTAYASYGWWIHKSADDKTYTASAFAAAKGTVDDPAISALNTLIGTATYMGGAAGKYALSSSTGGTNDAGHFTARAMLEADFGDATDGSDNITGTIDMFMGADGMARDWSVKLNKSAIENDGGITGNDTVWTIGGSAAKARGEWSGMFQNMGKDGVPQVATGTFYAEYGTAGKMVGAFGANVQ